MQRIASSLCRVLSLLACVMCAGGFTTSANAQTLPSPAIALEDELHRGDREEVMRMIQQVRGAIACKIGKPECRP